MKRRRSSHSKGRRPGSSVRKAGTALTLWNWNRSQISFSVSGLRRLSSLSESALECSRSSRKEWSTTPFSPLNCWNRLTLWGSLTSSISRRLWRMWGSKWLSSSSSWSWRRKASWNIWTIWDSTCFLVRESSTRFLLKSAADSSRFLLPRMQFTTWTQEPSRILWFVSIGLRMISQSWWNLPFRTRALSIPTLITFMAWLFKAIFSRQSTVLDSITLKPWEIRAQYGTTWSKMLRMGLLTRPSSGSGEFNNRTFITSVWNSTNSMILTNNRTWVSGAMIYKFSEKETNV